MKLALRVLSWSSPLLALLFVGCLGDQLGGEDGFECTEQAVTALESDEMSPLDFAADDVLAFAQGQFEAEMVWGLVRPSVAMTLVPESGTTLLRIDIADDWQTIDFVDRSIEGEENAGIQCADELRIATTAHVWSEDGAFDDVLPVTLTSSSHLVVSGLISLADVDLHGSFRLDIDQPVRPIRDQPIDTAEFLALELRFSITRDKHFAGSVFADVQVEGGAGDLRSVGLGSVLAAQFPLERPCEDGSWGQGAELGPDDDAFQQVARALAELDALALAWEGSGAPSELRTEFSLELLCAETLHDYDSTRGKATFSTNAIIRDTEGAELATWQLEGDVRLAASGELLELLIYQHSAMTEMKSPADFESAWGLSDIDWGEATEGALLFFIERQEGGSWQGELSVEARGGSSSGDSSCLEADPDSGCDGPELVAKAQVESLSLN